MGNVVLLKPRDRLQDIKPAESEVTAIDSKKGTRLSAYPKRFLLGIARALGRAAVTLTGAMVSLATRALWSCRHQVLVAFGLSALVMLGILAYQGLHGWSNPKLVMLSILGFVFFLGLTAIYDSLAHAFRKLDCSMNGCN